MGGSMRDHGGNIDQAMVRFGGTPGDWLDLSTGINRVSYPVPAIPTDAWQALPTRAAHQRLCAAAAHAYGCGAKHILPVAGAQAAIQMIPRARATGAARVLSPTYNEHAACLHTAGWQVDEVPEISALQGADLAVVVNPNNPDGARYTPAQLLALAENVGTLVVDESFADPTPNLSLAPIPPRKGLLILRSFGKFYGLAGVRLGFVLGHPDDLDAIAKMAGPWPVSGAAIEIGQIALRDDAWAAATTARLVRETSEIDALAEGAGWEFVGGTALFRLYRTPDAAAAQNRLAQAHIWSRIFPWSPDLIRLGLPGTPAEWAQLEKALT